MSRADVKEYLNTIIITTDYAVEVVTDLELEWTFDIVELCDDVIDDEWNDVPVRIVIYILKC